MQQREHHKFRVLQPLRVGGELVAVGQVVTLPAIVAQEQVEAGRLQPLEIQRKREEARPC